MYNFTLRYCLEKRLARHPIVQFQSAANSARRLGRVEAVSGQPTRQNIRRKKLTSAVGFSPAIGNFADVRNGTRRPYAWRNKAVLLAE
jgi:hypothetical protein